MKSIVNLRGVQATSRRQLRYSFQERLSDRCLALCQENAQLKAKLAKEKNNSVGLKRLTVQLCRESVEARDWVAQDKFLQEKVDKINNEISQSQEDFKAELHLEREKKRLLEEKLQKKCVFYQERSKRYASDNIDAINQVHKVQRELENCVRQNEGLEKDYEELRVAQIYCQLGVEAELDAEREKNTLLQEELRRKCVSYEEISQRYASDSISAKNQVDNLLRELENGVQQHKSLQKDHTELQAAHTFGQKNFTAELHAERQKNTLLQEELQRTCVSYSEISQRYASDSISAKNQVDNLLRELENGVQQHKSLQKDYKELCAAHTFSQKNFTAELHAERQKNTLLQEELQRTCVSYSEISQRYASDSISAKNQVDNLLRELENGVQQHKSLQKDYKELCAAHTFSQKNFTAELHAERQKNVVLQEELQRTCVSYYEMQRRSQGDEANAVPDAPQPQPPDERARHGTNDITLDTDVDMGVC